MKCSDCQKRLPLYSENGSELAEKQSIENHLQSCAACRAILHSLQEESEAIAQAIGLERLPASFARSILDQLGPYPIQLPQADVTAISKPPAPSRKRREVNWKRAIAVACVTIFLVVSAGTIISPAFADYISSFISRIGGELGLKRAAEQGFSIPVNQAVTDQGITLRINDIVADPTRLVVSYVLEDESGRVLPNLFVPAFNKNRVYLTDDAGNVISESPNMFQQGIGYADYMFMLKKPPNDLIVHIDIASLKPAVNKQGSWKLDVPVNLSRSIQASKYVPIEGSTSSSHGIAFALEGVMYGPSATRFTLATRRTPEEEARLKQLNERNSGPDGPSYGEYSLEYRIEDKEGRIVASQSQTALTVPVNRHIYFTPGYSSPPESNGDGVWRWYGAFVPSVEPEELWFVLEAIVKTEPADFSIPFRPTDLTGTPVTKRYDEGSSTYTVKQMTKGTDPTTNEPVWLITLSGMMPESDFPQWKLYDDTGRSYELSTDYSVSSVSGNRDGAVLDQTLIIKGLPSLPEKLTLSLQTFKKRYADLNWKVAIPPER